MPEAGKTAKIECEQDLYIQIATRLQHAITGKNVYYGDSLVDLVNRHCPDLYDTAKAKGFSFVPSPDKEALLQMPMGIWFDVVRI